MNSHRGLAALLAAAGIVAPATAHAQRREDPAVAVVVDPCTGVTGAAANAVRQIVANELGARLEDDGAATTTRVAVRCEGGSVLLYVEDRVTDKTLTRALELPPGPADVRRRLLAEAAAELVAASWIELAEAPAPPGPPTAAALPPEPRAATREVVRERVPALRSAIARLPPTLGRPPTVRVLGVVSAQGFVGAGANAPVLYGGGVRVSSARPAALGWSAGVVYARGGAETFVGQLVLDGVSADAQLTLGTSWRWLGLWGGAGVRAGAVVLTGVPVDPSRVRGGSVFAPWVGPMAQLGVRLTPARGFTIELAGEFGYDAFSVLGHVFAGPDIAARGPWLGAHAGLGGFL